MRTSKRCTTRWISRPTAASSRALPTFHRQTASSAPITKNVILFLFLNGCEGHSEIIDTPASCRMKMKRFIDRFEVQIFSKSSLLGIFSKSSLLGGGGRISFQTVWTKTGRTPREVSIISEWPSFLTTFFHREEVGSWFDRRTLPGKRTPVLPRPRHFWPRETEGDGFHEEKVAQSSPDGAMRGTWRWTFFWPSSGLLLAFFWPSSGLLLTFFWRNPRHVGSLIQETSKIVW